MPCIVFRVTSFYESIKEQAGNTEDPAASKALPLQMWSSPAVPKLRYGFMLYRRATKLGNLKHPNMLAAIWFNHCFEETYVIQ